MHPARNPLAFSSSLTLPVAIVNAGIAGGGLFGSAPCCVLWTEGDFFREARAHLAEVRNNLLLPYTGWLDAALGAGKPVNWRRIMAA
jgi:hypothetical protein